MGLLDDAIREHLELKRRRGADPDEVARQEGEALSDPRGGEFAKPDAAPEPEVAAVAAPEPEAEPFDDRPAPELDPAPAAVAPEPEPEPEPEPVVAPEPVTRDDAPWLEDDEHVEPAGQPTAEFTPPDVEPEPEVVAADEEPDEDVLEETPDFLQETPEHDRLWFEQKPPRDFDFDN